MKISLCLSVALALVAVGCDNQAGKPSSASGSSSSNSSVVTAPVDYLGAMAKAKQNADKTVDVTSIDKAIQLFQVDKGRNPTDLNELVQEKYIPQIPQPPYGTKLVYDAGSGKVSIVKQ